jgi:superfamily II DNA or RNA helicase
MIIDECDLAEAPSYKSVITAVGNPPLLGLTATAERLDGRGLGDIFDIIVTTCGTMDLIEEGLAPPVRYFNCAPDMTTTSLHRRAGEFAQDEVSALMDRPALIGDAVRSWEQHALGRPTIYFTSGIKHAINTAEAFCAAGYRAIAVSGESTNDERDAALIDLRAGRVDIVCNAALWIAGVDSPNVSCIGLLYITASLRKYLQSIGRGMRICEGKTDLIVLDHGNNIGIHGNPLAQREWSLDGRDARRKAEDEDDIAIRQCPQCFRITRATVTTCPSCGHIWQPKPREVRQVEGELSEVDLSAQRRIARIEQGRADSMDALVKLGHSPARAAIILAARAEKDSLRQQVRAARPDIAVRDLLKMKPKELRGMLP